MQLIFKKSTIASAVTAMLLAVSLSGCGTVQPHVNALEKSTTNNIVSEQVKAAQTVPVITTTTAAWLMGQTVQVMPTPSPILARMITYHPTQRVLLSDVAAWISQTTGLVVDTAEVQSSASNGQLTQGAYLGGSASIAAPGNLPLVPSLSSFAGASPPFPANTSNTANPQSLSISYAGPLSGLLDVAANKAGLWWKFSDGRLVFYRTETRTFYLPAIARKSSGSSSIATSSGMGGSTAGSASSSGASSGGTSSGGATSTSEYLVDVWGELEKTAKIVGGNAQVVANTSMGSLTVTGTPTQVRNVEEWAKSLADNLSQQVAITVQIYKIKVTNEDNYNWNPSVVFNTLSSKYGFTLSGPQTPAVLSGLAPLNLAANVLQTATGRAAQYTGSQLAFQALSTLGRVTETMQQTIVTLNGQPAPIQVANQLSYLASTTPGAATALGAAPIPPTLTPGTITTGFTAMFLPRIVNGKILLSMNLTSSTLVALGSVSSGGSNIQTPNVDLSTFQQSVTLTPGDSLLLTGLQLDNGKTNHSGVGSPNNYLLGGGVDNNIGKQLIAIVITAKVL